mmetsp:Transcript_13770/g.20994  ORF Transcript_13770/g.20994 Transcript_13770/m.20994 type:complete len:218 (+) Transcript_13770:46-699(+)
MNSKYSDIKQELPFDFQPGQFDVVCGKGKKCFDHPGNKELRKTTQLSLEEYSQAKTKVEKSRIVTKIINIVKRQNPEGGFVKLDASSGRWHEVGDLLAREKVGQHLRDALHTKYRSSTKAKKRLRVSHQEDAAMNMTDVMLNNDKIQEIIHCINSKVTTDMADHQFTNTFTNANLEILNELNQANQFTNKFTNANLAILSKLTKVTRMNRSNSLVAV